MSKVVELLRGEFDRSGLTLDELIAKAGLDGVTRPAMSRKIRGERGCDPDEVAKIARVFSVVPVWTGKTFRLRRAA